MFSWSMAFSRASTTPSDVEYAFSTACHASPLISFCVSPPIIFIHSARISSLSSLKSAAVSNWYMGLNPIFCAI